jgi:hypothetical protein
MLDRLAMRTLGGVRVLDHLTGQPLLSGLRLESATLRFAATASGAFQIVSAPGFEAYARAFDPVPAVAVETFDFAVHDLTRRFLPVAASIALPRDASPAALTDRVDTPVMVTLPSAGSRFPVAGMTALRATLVDQTGAPVRGALVRAMRGAGEEELGWGLSDRLGSAFIPLIGLPPLRETEPPPDAEEDDAAPLVTAVTVVRLRVTADRLRGWPAHVARLRTGGAGFVTLNPAEDIELSAGGSAHRRLAITLN